MTKYKWINRWICCQLDNFHFAIAVLLGVVYVTGYLAEMESLKRAGCVGGFFFLLLFFLHKNLHAHYQFLVLHESIDRIPVGQMKQVNAMFISLFLGVLAIGMAWIPYIHPERLLKPLGRLIVLLLGWIATWFQAEESEAPQAVRESGGWGGMPEMPEYETSWITTLLNYLEILVGYCLIILLIGYALYSLYRLLQKLFQPRKFDDDEKIFLKPEFFSKTVKKETQPKEKKLWRDFSYSGRVRRYYKKTVQTKKRMDATIPTSASPKEIEQIAGFTKEEDMLHLLYEKARYSQSGCQKEDWDGLA